MRNDKGFALVAVLLFTAIVALLIDLSLARMNKDLKLATDDRLGKQAFILADSGVEEARGRLCIDAGTGIVIPDNTPNDPNWVVYIGTAAKVTALGWSGDSSQRFDNSSGLNYAAKIVHKVNASNQILKYGDANLDGKPEENTTTGESIYVVISRGEYNGVVKTIRTEIARTAPVTVPAAFYSKENVSVKGSSTIIRGDTVPGVLSKAGVSTSGNPSVTGTPPIVTGSPIEIDVAGMVDSLKGGASDTRVNPGTITGANWGNPLDGATADAPLGCNTKEIVYIEGNVKLAGGSKGCGILLVKGDLDLNGGFKWYGPILVTGDVKYTGGGQKNITGGILSGGLGDLNDIGGNAAINYSGSAVYMQTVGFSLVTLRWSEI